MKSNLVSIMVQVLDHLIVAIFVGHEEGPQNGASVRIESFAVEHVLVLFIVV